MLQLGAGVDVSPDIEKKLKEAISKAQKLDPAKMSLAQSRAILQTALDFQSSTIDLLNEILADATFSPLWAVWISGVVMANEQDKIEGQISAMNILRNATVDVISGSSSVPLVKSGTLMLLNSAVLAWQFADAYKHSLYGKIATVFDTAWGLVQKLVELTGQILETASVTLGLASSILKILPWAALFVGVSLGGLWVWKKFIRKDDRDDRRSMRGRDYDIDGDAHQRRIEARPRRHPQPRQLPPHKTTSVPASQRTTVRTPARKPTTRTAA